MDSVLEITSHFPIGNVSLITPLSTGLIHSTYRAHSATGTYILQRMSTVFAPSVLEDMRDVTEHLTKNGLTTFSLIPTSTGELSYYDGMHHWRLITFIPGRTLQSVPTPEELRSAGRLVGRFHEVLSSFTGTLRHRIPGFHDTHRYMTHLTSLDTSQVHTDKHQALHPLTEKVLTLYSQLPKEIDTLPTRILHGDPKLENILFKEDAEEAIALIDLDTVGTYPLLIEIGDLGRSWTRVTNRDGKAAFSPERWHTAFDGYRETATSVTPAEWRLFPYGCLLVTLELSARFIIDAYEEFYFAHDIEKFPTRYEQNLFAAKDQLAFLDDFIKKMPEIQAMHSV